MKFALNKERRGADNPNRITSVAVGEGKMHREFKVGKDDTVDIPDRYHAYTRQIEAHGFTRIDRGAKDFEDPTGEDTKTKASESTPRKDVGEDHDEDEE